MWKDVQTIEISGMVRNVYVKSFIHLYNLKHYKMARSDKKP